MAIAAVAHIFVFSAEPYRYIPVSEYGVTIETVKEAAEVKEGKEHKPTVVERTETHVEAPGTSVTESVQDIVLEGGQRVSIISKHMHIHNQNLLALYADTFLTGC